MDFSSVLISITVMATTIALGVFLELKLRTNKQVQKTIIFIIINIALPSVILNGIFNSEINTETFAILRTIFLFSLVLNGGGILLGYALARLFKWGKSKARQMAVLAGLGNAGFIGIPLCASIFGPLGGLYASLFDAGLTLTVFTIGILLLQQESTFSWRSFKHVINPPVIAVVLGLTLAASGFQAPVVLKQLTGNLSGLAAPLAMFYIGIIIPGMLQVFKENKYIRLTVLPVFVKLLLFPIGTILLMKYITVIQEVKEIIIIQTAMPTLLLASILFARHGHDESYGGMAVIYSTLASLMTIPLIAFLANSLL